MTASPPDRDGPEERARAACLNALGRRMHSRRELEIKLARKGIAPEIAAGVLDRLTEVGLVDDAAYARAFVAERQRRRPRGAFALQAELAARGVDRETAEVVLAETADAEDPVEVACRALEPRRRSLERLPRDRARAKAGQFLRGRGFGFAVAAEAVDRVLPGDP